MIWDKKMACGRRSQPTAGRLALLLGALLGCGCTTAPATPQRSTADYPPVARPEVQLLATISHAGDLQRQPTAFQRFVVGASRDPAQVISDPAGLAVRGGKLLVTDRRSRRIHEIDLRLGTFAPPRPDTELLVQPEAIALSPDGRRYVADVARGWVLAFGADGRFEEVLPLQQGATPGRDRAQLASLARGPIYPISALAVSAEHLFVATPSDHQVAVLDAEARGWRRSLGHSGLGEGEFYYPSGMTCDGSGNLLVCDALGGRVQRITPQGKLLQTFGRRGDGLGELRRPRALATDREGRVYVVDEGLHVVHVFGADGHPLFQFGGPAGPWEGLEDPVAIAIDYEDRGVFADRVAPGRRLSHLIFVASRSAAGKVAVFGYVGGEAP